MPVTKSVFDAASDITAYTLTNASGRLKVKIIDYGATIVSIIVPDREDVERDVVLGFDDLDGYQNKRPPLRNPYFGATIGRVANRIANAAFELNGQRYQLTANSGALSLHSGPQGFDKRKWSLVGEEGQSITLEYRAADGESGYPGALRVRIHFNVTDEGELKLQYSAALEDEGSSNVSTVVNLTNHSYFNLNGVSGGGEASSILKHKVLMAAANFFIEVDDSLVPTGKLAPVAGTLLDFTGQARAVEERVHQVKPAGYDHCFVLEADPAKWAIAPAELRQAALVVWSPLSGIKLEMATTEPGFQFYTGSKIMEGHRQKASQGKGLEPLIGPYSGFCAEASRFPDAPNQWPAQVVLAPGQQYAQTTVYKFGLASEL